MSFGVNDAAYGRDINGARKLLTELNADIDKAIKSLIGSDYTKLRDVIKNNWQGDDATQFAKGLEVAINDITAEFKKYKKYLETAVEEDLKQFQQMQTQNASNLKEQQLKF